MISWSTELPRPRRKLVYAPMGKVGRVSPGNSPILDGVADAADVDNLYVYFPDGFATEFVSSDEVLTARDAIEYN